MQRFVTAAMALVAIAMIGLTTAIWLVGTDWIDTAPVSGPMLDTKAAFKQLHKRMQLEEIEGVLGRRADFQFHASFQRGYLWYNEDGCVEILIFSMTLKLDQTTISRYEARGKYRAFRAGTITSRRLMQIQGSRNEAMKLLFDDKVFKTNILEF
jgi:hypothetical protein